MSPISFASTRCSFLATFAFAILDNIPLYWLTNTAVSSARLYRENKLAFFAPQGCGDPGCRECVSRRTLSGLAELGLEGVSQTYPLQPAAQRLSLRRLGTARIHNSGTACGFWLAALDKFRKEIYV